MRQTLYLIDGSAYVYRAYHAIQRLFNSDGLPTNASFGFCKILMRLLQERDPEYVGILFDKKGSTFRHDLYENYKANRPPMPEDMAIQFPYIKKIIKGLNIPALELDRYEADDLMGALACQAEQAGFDVVLITGDKDFLQLLTDHISVWEPMKNKTIDIQSFRSEKGIEPSQMLDVMGFWGDSSDNIPGVPGIGEKTALSLIKTFGSMDKVYKNLDTLKKKKKQHENLTIYKKQAFLSRKLVKIKTDAPITFEPELFKRKQPDKKKLSKLFKELEFRQFQKLFAPKPAPIPKNYTAIYDAASLDNLINRLKYAKIKIFALDTETTSQNPMQADLVGISVALQANEAFYIPCGHIYQDAPQQLDRKTVLEKFRTILESSDYLKIGQNIKYDWIVLERHGVKLKGVFFDTMLASYLLNPSKRAHNLDQIASDFLDHQTTTYKEVAGKGKQMVLFSQVPLEKAVPYACEDADITLMAYNLLKPELEKIGLSDLMQSVEMPLIPVLKNMEMQGICVDENKLRELSKSFEHQLNQLEKDIFALAGENFNIKSSQQLGNILFEKLGLPVQKKTRKKIGYSTDVEVLTLLAENHELPALILRHRSLAKLKSTYTDALLGLIHSKTLRIHTSYNQTVTATGRLSSSDPNLQNIPIRTEEGRDIRRAFVPQKDWLLLSADYSQIELRLLAHYSKDEILIKAFVQDEDIHTRTASEIFEVFPQMITPDLRRQAKTINFGIIYGMGAFSLSKELGITRKMAQTYIDHYFRRYKGVQIFIDETIEQARKTSQTSTLLGRIRLLPDINSPNKNIKAFAERIAVNTPIQGTAADLIKLAMIQVDAKIKAENLKTAMLLSVHDELVFEVPPEELNIVKNLVKDIMENIWPDLRVPLKVNINWGKNWAEAH